MSLRLLLVWFLILPVGCVAQLDSIVNQLSKQGRFFSPPSELGYFDIYVIDFFGDQLDSIRPVQRGYPTDYYYYQMDSIATSQELIELTKHRSPSVQAYAAYALSQRDTNALDEILKNMLDDTVHIDMGMAGRQPSAHGIFIGLRDRRYKTTLPSQQFIDQLDSIYLAHPNALPILIGVKLINLRSKTLNPVIKDLAFDRQNFYAIEYLYKWYLADNYDALNLLCLDQIKFDQTHQALIPLNSYLKRFYDMLIDLKHEETLTKLGNWMNENRVKWTTINGIDNLIDESHVLKDIIGFGDERYPLDENSISSLLGRWQIVSGMNDQSLDHDDIIVLKKTNESTIKNARILEFEVNGNSLSAAYHVGNSSRIVGSLLHNAIGQKVCINCFTVYNWYYIEYEGEQLTLRKEYSPF